MEQLIHYVWKHKLFPLTGLKTTDGQEVEVIDTGLHNHNAGPDFFNAKVKIGGTLWVGNVEIHDRASDWFLHRHDRDPNYNNVILHVAESIDVDVKTRRGDYPHRCDYKCRRLYENITKNCSQQTSIRLVIVSFRVFQN